MLTTQPNYTIYEYSCHEGNQAVANALRGERAYERAVLAAAAEGKPPPERIPSSGANLAPPPEGARIFDINKGE
jgi:hypothetical protein